MHSNINQVNLLMLLVYCYNLGAMNNIIIKKRQGGFIQLIILIIVAFVVLRYFDLTLTGVLAYFNLSWTGIIDWIKELFKSVL